MTKEQYGVAKDYRHDIYLLDCIMNSQLKSHWIKFVTPDGLDMEAYSEVFLDDFEEWVQKEREKLEKLFEESMSNEELIEFAKDQCEIFPEDSYMGKYLREITLLKKIKQAREEIDTDVRTTVKHFTNADAVIDYVLDSIDELIESEEE